MKMINKSDLVQIMAKNKKIRLYKKEWKIIVDELYKAIEIEIKNGNSIRIPGIGKITNRENRRKTVILNGNNHSIKSRKTVCFKPIKTLNSNFKEDGD